MAPIGYDVFLSYDAEDRERARMLAARIEERGWSVWLDSAELKGGDDWTTTIRQSVDSSKCVIVLWSAASVRNQGYMQAEVEMGRDRGKLFPVLLDEVEPPAGYESFQSALLSEWDGSASHPQLQALLVQLERVLGPPSAEGAVGKEVAEDEQADDAEEATGDPSEAPAENETDPPAEANKTIWSRLAGIAQPLLFVGVLAGWGITTAIGNLREINVRFTFGPLVEWAVSPQGLAEGDVASSGVRSLGGLDPHGQLGDMASRGPHALDEFVLVIQRADSGDVSGAGDTLAVVRSLRESVLVAGADTASALSQVGGAQPADTALQALLTRGVLRGDPSGYLRATAGPDDVSGQRAVEMSRSLRVDQPLRLSLVRVDWGEDELVSQITVRVDQDCEEATGGGGFLGSGQLYDCFVWGGPPVPPAAAVDPLNTPLWIEGGTFQMGAEDLTSNEQPVHPVTVSSFWMQEHEVTNEEYARFDPTHPFQSGTERHPVVNVNWQQAMDYAESRGGSLPTEAQWEFAARGVEGRTYPWGDAAPTCQLAHYSGCDPLASLEVMSRPTGATPEGVHDLAGNVFEWTADWFGDYSPAAATDPRGPSTGQFRVLRGGSFLVDTGNLRGADRNRDAPGAAYGRLGFRVVWSSAGGQN